MIFVHDDGGRAAAGFKGTTGDCVVRAIAIAARRPYKEVYDRCAEINAKTRKTKGRTRAAGRRSARSGVYTKQPAFRRYMEELGFRWVPLMKIGGGCTHHMRAGELPGGRIIVNLSRHLAAVIDGVLHDNHDCTRGGDRCVYGYWALVA